MAKRATQKKWWKPQAAGSTAKAAQDWLHAAIDAAPVGIVLLDEEGRYILWNERYAQIYEESAAPLELGARREHSLQVGMGLGPHSGAAGRPDERIAQRAEGLNPGGAREQLLSDGRWILIEERKMADGCTIGMRVDVTDLKKREEGLRLLFESNPVPIFLFDAHTHQILAVNRSACEGYGYKDAEIVGRPVDVIYDEPTRAGARPDGPWRGRKRDGSIIHTTTYSRELKHEGRDAILLAVVDVTERRRAETRLAYMARHDALTNLPNRIVFREKVEEYLPRARDRGCPFAVLLFDLDHFKGINDTLGHSIGDKLLQEMARRVLACLGPDDLVARLGGDEFAVIHGGADVASTVIALVERMVEEVRRPYDLDGHQVAIGASVGIALAPRDGENPEMLLKNADLALYAAKRQGRGMFVFFEPAMDEILQERRKLESELRTAMLNGGLSVHYQPLIDLQSGKPSGYEALLRWIHAERGLVPPTLFVPLAEDTGLIGALGQMALHRACADAARWPGDLKVAVNLSPVQFKSCNVLETVVHALASSGLPAQRLELEITEALLLERDDSVIAALSGLRELGVGISLDDFGTGYSSLSYLRSFPFTKIKIDQSFVKDVRANPDSQAVVRAILGLGANLGLKVLAEGIEHEDDLAFLIKEGCREGQGYLFSEARPVEELFPNGPSVARAAAPVAELAAWRDAQTLAAAPSDADDASDVG